ncbi:30S ribosomal protein S4 [Candidatus Woesearchaeota archaeon]|nr:30S ribosomal protein S4 [Candidatus Woesearchaeota archaeon]
MGDPRKTRKKYKGPRHPWQRERIDEERKILKNYGLKNKKEIMKANSEIKRVATHAKKLIRDRIKGLEQVQVEEKQLIERLQKLKLIGTDAKLENILDLSLFDLLERRLQTIIYKLGLVRSLKQARQFIIHGHISIDGRKTNIPSLLVGRELENKINFVSSSSIADPTHPERSKSEKKQKRKGGKETQEELGDEFKEIITKEAETIEV